MKQLTIYFAILLSLLLTACGGGTETKKPGNEQKISSKTLTNSNTSNPQNATTNKVDADDYDADDSPKNKTSANSNVDSPKSEKLPKKDVDDFNKKGDTDDKNRKTKTDKDDDDDDK